MRLLAFAFTIVFVWTGPESAECRLEHFLYLSIAFVNSLSFLISGMLFPTKDTLPGAPADPRFSFCRHVTLIGFKTQELRDLP